MRKGSLQIRRWASGWLATAAVLATGCASVDPSLTVAATAETLAAHGVSGADWRRTPEAGETALELSRRLLQEPLTPTRAAQVALLRSHELQAELAELGIAQADLAQATRLANPGVTFESISGDGETKRTGGLAADVVDWLTQPLRRRLAEADVERVKLEVAAAVFDRVVAAESALVEVQAARAVVALRSRVEEAERAASDYAAALLEAGNLTRRERSLVEASWVERRAELQDAVAQETRAVEALLRTLGLGPEDTWTAEPLGEPPASAAADDLEQEATRLRLDLAAARWSLASLEQARGLRRKTRWLPVGVELGVERETESGVRLTGPTVALALPIFDTGRASLARYDAEILRARSQLAGLELRIRSEVRETRGAYQAAVSQASLYRDSLLPLRRQALELTVRESNQMLVGAFEVLAAKQDVLDAELLYLEAVSRAWMARIDLQRALGRLLEPMEPMENDR